MTDNEIKREKTFSEELPYFKERIKEVFDNYSNPNGYDDPLYIAVLRDSNRIVRKAEEEINRQQEEIDRLTYNLWGVMHSVDKWLDGTELEQDELNRAVTMREKTLRIVEEKQAEIEALITGQETLQKYIAKAKAEAVKEFTERLKNKIKTECNPYGKPTFDYDTSLAIMRYINNLVKENVNNEKGESEAMNKIFYLFIFADNSTYETNCAVSFKDAVLEMAKNTGNSSDMFCKCLTAYKDDEIDKIIELFNHFCSYDYDEISKVYVIDRKIFDDKE